MFDREPTPYWQQIFVVCFVVGIALAGLYALFKMLEALLTGR